MAAKPNIDAMRCEAIAARERGDADTARRIEADRLRIISEAMRKARKNRKPRTEGQRAYAAALKRHGFI